MMTREKQLEMIREMLEYILFETWINYERSESTMPFEKWFELYLLEDTYELYNNLLAWSEELEACEGEE